MSNKAVTTAPGEQTKIFNSAFISLLVINMMMHMGQQMSGTLISKYAKVLGAAPDVIGIVASLFAVTALVFKLFSAPAIDTFNRKYILMGAMVVYGISFVGFSLSRSIPALVVSRLIQGSAMAFTSTCCLALASDALPQDKLGSGLGVFSLTQAGSQAIGPSVGLALADKIGFPMTFALSAGLMFVSAIVTLFVKINHTPGRKFHITVSSIIAKEAIIPASMMFLFSTAFSTFGSFLVVAAEEIGVQNIGLYFTVYALTLLVSRPIVGKLSDKLGTVKVVIPAMFFFAAAFMIISFSKSLPMYLFAAMVSAFGYGACQPTIQALCMRCVPRERRGAGSCTNYIGTDLGMLAGPMIGGAIATSFGYPVMWRCMIIPIVCAFIFIFFYRHRINKIDGIE